MRTQLTWSLWVASYNSINLRILLNQSHVAWQSLIRDRFPCCAAVSLRREDFVALRKVESEAQPLGSGTAGSGAGLLAGDRSLCSREFISCLPGREKLGCLLLFKVRRNCRFPEVFTATIRQVLSWQTVTVVTIKLPPLTLISEKNCVLITAYATDIAKWKIKSSTSITLSQQADLNCNIQDDTGAFYGVTSQYESSENMTITCSTKVCSFGKQVVEKVEVGVVMGWFSGSLSF